MSNKRPKNQQPRPFPFEEETAAKIAREMGLPAATVRTWRHRGTIPGEYAKAAHLALPASPDEATKAMALKAELLPRVKFFALCRAKMVSPWPFYSKARLTLDHLRAVATAKAEIQAFERGTGPRPAWMRKYQTIKT